MSALREIEKLLEGLSLLVDTIHPPNVNFCWFVFIEMVPISTALVEFTSVRVQGTTFFPVPITPYIIVL